MFRPHSVTLAPLVPILVALASLAGACAGPAEEPIVRQFFRASQLRDRATLANFSTVSFEPQSDGVVTSFEITSTSEERTRPLQFRDLAKAHEEARAADDEFTKRKRAYQDQNMEAIDRVLAAERQKAKLRGKDAEVQAAWTKWRDETAQYAKRVSETRTRLAAERPIAELSLENPREPIDLTKYDGELVAKDVTVAAQVRQPDGQVVPKTLVMTLQRARLKRENQPDLMGRWLITSIKDVSSGPTKTS